MVFIIIHIIIQRFVEMILPITVSHGDPELRNKTKEMCKIIVENDIYFTSPIRYDISKNRHGIKNADTIRYRKYYYRRWALWCDIFAI